MKVLKQVTSGLICYEDFDTALIADPLRSYASFERYDSYLNLLEGSIYLNLGEYEDLVFVVDNEFVPSSIQDVGGVSILRGSETRDLFEYYNELDTSGGVVRYVKVIKDGDVYIGYGSNNGYEWDDRGYIVFQDAETIGVRVETTTPYKLNAIKVFKKDYVTIFSVMPGWRIEAYRDILKVAEVTSTGLKATINIPNYPFNGIIKVYDEANNLVSDYTITGVWGGDEFVCTPDVDLLTLDNIPLEYDIPRHLGNLQNGRIENQYIAHNNNNIETTVTLKIADYSPFGDWASLATDSGDAPNEYMSSINLTIPANSDAYFWLLITRPDDGGKIKDWDFRNNECTFYISVE